MKNKCQQFMSSETYFELDSEEANNTFHCSCRRQRVTQEHRRDLGHCYEALSICRLGHNHIDNTLVNNK